MDDSDSNEADQRFFNQISFGNHKRCALLFKE